MLLVVDIGNTHTAFGLFDGDTLRFDWRIETRRERTADEHAAIVHGLFGVESLDMRQVDAAIISSVVPSATMPMERLFARYFNITSLVVGPGMKTRCGFLYETFLCIIGSLLRVRRTRPNQADIPGERLNLMVAAGPASKIFMPRLMH